MIKVVEFCKILLHDWRLQQNLVFIFHVENVMGGGVLQRTKQHGWWSFVLHKRTRSVVPHNASNSTVGPNCTVGGAPLRINVVLQSAPNCTVGGAPLRTNVVLQSAPNSTVGGAPLRTNVVLQSVPNSTVGGAPLRTKQHGWWCSSPHQTARLVVLLFAPMWYSNLHLTAR